MTRRHRSAPAALPTALLLALLLGLTACSGGGSDEASGAGSTADTADTAADAVGPESALSSAVEGGSGSSAARARPAAVEPATPAIISTGSLEVRADDVAAARDEVQDVLDQTGGTVAEERSTSDDDGAVESTRLVLRVPSEDFAVAMEALEGIGVTEDSRRASEDVTTQVVDNEVRVRAQRASIARIEALLARAETIGAVISIEGQLTRRQADLDSLLAQQAYLTDQTSLSTITVRLARTPDPSSDQRPEEDRSGFLAGLAAGWDGLSSVAVGAATALGAVLPFAVVALLLGVPLALLVRSLRAGRTARTP
ncbi:DUF4349 domain-containing protein [Nocardioides sp. Leaf285]|uniref:DUF4349 domain-containing protein n=1 Tax=Nocardioides sp. Leaf285 TaxID=1736322 RepID=UPI00070277CD|nr:DUF4349 domain-containing protein [Nocardioides sp. Leaf285]KQP66262.1 hypothetical protein ASF47_00055 [Nocardioides sp. Leaf285]